VTLPPTIEHVRDIIRDDAGGIEQIYNHLIYRFERSDVIARTYLDQPDVVSIMSPGPIDAESLGYLQERFWRIDQLGREGYVTIWSA